MSRIIGTIIYRTYDFEYRYGYYKAVFSPTFATIGF